MPEHSTMFCGWTLVKLKPQSRRTQRVLLANYQKRLNDFVQTRMALAGILCRRSNWFNILPFPHPLRKQQDTILRKLTISQAS